MGGNFFASGKAQGDVRVFRLEEEGFWRMMSLCPTVSREILKTMAQRVQNLETISQAARSW
jgi:CRP-like cAMP-binding protein